MKEEFDILFITTFINTDYFYSLVSSIENNNSTIKTLLLAVNQTEKKLDLEKLSNENNSIIELMSERISLSHSRNVGIKYLFDKNLNTRYVAFPDDDTTFDLNFFYNFNKIITDNTKNYLIDVYGAGTRILYLKNNKNEGSQIAENCEKLAMSINMIINLDTIRKTGFFDEKLGIGALYGAGEDTDYFFRCVYESGAFTYTKLLWDFHPQYEKKHNEMSFKVLLKKYRNYGRGVIYMNYKHHLYVTAIKLCFSALFGSIVAFFHFDLKLMIVRFYAFFVRIFTLVGLILGIIK